MFFKPYYLGCLAHASYLIGGNGAAAIIDPRRDVEEYLADAEAEGRPEPRGHRVIFQVGSEGQEAWSGVPANVEDPQKAFGPASTQIEVVCFGRDRDMLLNTDAPASAHVFFHELAQDESVRRQSHPSLCLHSTPRWRSTRAKPTLS